MNLISAPDPREVSFFSIAPQGKIKEKKIPREGGEEVAKMQDGNSLKK